MTVKLLERLNLYGHLTESTMAQPKIQRPSDLEVPQRFITDIDASGFAIFDTTIPNHLPTEVAGNLVFHFGYATTSFPADFSNQSDITTYSSFLNTPPGIFIANGSVLRIVDIQPREETPLHQTESLDYGVVLEGEIELELDSGQIRVLRRGDISVQRGTNHLWRNTSSTKWSRMMFVSLGAKPRESTDKN